MGRLDGRRLRRSFVAAKKEGKEKEPRGRLPSCAAYRRVGELSFKKTLPPGNSPLFPIFPLPIYLASHFALYLPNPRFHHKHCIQQHISIAFSLLHSHLASSESCIPNLRSIACITVTMRPSVVGAAISLLSYSAGVAAQTSSDCNPLQDSEFSCHFQMSGISC